MKTMADGEHEGETNNRTERPRFGGGPHGLGDPDDTSLRKVEKDVLVKKKLRDKARDEKCPKEVAEFTACCKEAGLLSILKCRKETSVMKACLEQWYLDKEFNEECEKEYLAERSRYRRTGIPVKNDKSKKLPVSM